jgi:hypothetical protein
MVLNCLSNDMDLVQPTKYLTSKSRIAKKPPRKPEPLPPSQPLPIYVIWRTTYHPCMQLIDWCTPGTFFSFPRTTPYAAIVWSRSVWQPSFSSRTSCCRVPNIKIQILPHLWLAHPPCLFRLCSGIPSFVFVTP